MLLEDRVRTYTEQLQGKRSIVKSTQEKIERMKDSLGVPKQDYEKVKNEVEKIKAQTQEKETAYEQLKVDNWNSKKNAEVVWLERKNLEKEKADLSENLRQTENKTKELEDQLKTVNENLEQVNLKLQGVATVEESSSNTWEENESLIA